MAQRAADRAAVAGLAMADQGDRLVHQGKAPGCQLGEFEVALTRHRAHLHAFGGLANIAEAFDAIEIDDVVRLDVTEVQHRHQRLPARQQLGVFKRRQQAHHLRDRPRIVIVERGRLHCE